MILSNCRFLSMSAAVARARLVAVALPVALVFALGLAASSQQAPPATPAPPPAQPDAIPQPAAPGTTPSAEQTPSNPAQDAGAKQVTQEQATPEQAPPAPGTGSQSAVQQQKPVRVNPAVQPPEVAPAAEMSGGITEEELKQMLVGKELFLRGGYLGDSISFNEHGRLNGHAPYGSYTLCAVEIDKIHLTKHKVELEGARYGLHFLGALPYEDPTKAVDRVRITPKKKMLKITIDREVVVKPKKVKAAKPAKGKAAPAGTGAGAAAKPAPGAGIPAAKPGPVATAEPAEMSEADQLKAEIAAAPEAERPADPASVTWTTLPAHATKVLKEALDHVFAAGLDERMKAEMPKFWKLYYEAAAAKTDYRPADPEVLRQNTVDQKAKLLSTFEPPSNEYAQANGVAGMALYHAVIGTDGKPGEIAVARPIGFGLDENAVNAIRNAKFEPAIKDGKPVPVLLDLVVEFRIYSKRTAVTGLPEPADKPATPTLPGPYSVQRPQ